ncbi:MAG: ABC transporter ATP-binding protein [Acetobacteraceae bacterium]|nr:ABC transporter ATP-binding protein [Acetobacteraceae bacterium]
MTDALEIDRVSSGYGEAIVLRGVSLAVSAGSVLAVLGKNGMGKTTLLKTVMGFLPPREGHIRVRGEDVTGIRPDRLSSRAVTYSPQDQAIFGELTVEENLRLGVPRRRLFAAGLERVAAFFPVLAQRRSQTAGTLSGGEQKMLIMARALMGKPALMLVDEITEGLQPSVIARLADVLRAQRAEGTAILLIEQNIGFALDVADHYAVLARGEIVARGEAEASAASRIADHLAV